MKLYNARGNYFIKIIVVKSKITSKKKKTRLHPFSNDVVNFNVSNLFYEYSIQSFHS